MFSPLKRKKGGGEERKERKRRWDWKRWETCEPWLKPGRHTRTHLNLTDSIEHFFSSWDAFYLPDPLSLQSVVSDFIWRFSIPLSLSTPSYPPKSSPLSTYLESTKSLSKQSWTIWESFGSFKQNRNNAISHYIGMWRRLRYGEHSMHRGLLQWLSGKESSCNAGDVGRIPGWARSPGGNGYLLQYACLGKPMDRGA